MQKLGVLATTLSIFFSASAHAYDIEVDGIYYITIPTTKEAVVTYKTENSYSGTVVIPSTVPYNEEQYTVTAIWDFAFSQCKDLTSITIPNSVTTIREFAFSDCRRLTSITIPNSVTTIANATFLNCSGLTSITIPNSVTSIGESAFGGCLSLTSVTIPNSVTTIGAYAFRHCKSLISIDIPNSVTTIGNSAFSECSSLTTINIPNSVTTIKDNTFFECTSLTSITIPGSVTTIEDSAFNGSSLTTITSLAIAPPVCGSSAFNRVDKQVCTLYVPKGSKETYQQAPVWKDFVRIEEVEAGIETIEVGAYGTAEVFNLTGLKVADSVEALPAGIYLVRAGSTVQKIIVR